MFRHVCLGIGICLLLAVGTISGSDTPPRSLDGVWIAIPFDPMSDSGDSSRSFELNRNKLEEIIERAPLELTDEADAVAVNLAVPMPDGTYATFRIEESPILHDELAASFPGINTFKGKHVEDPAVTMRFDRTPLGFHAIVLSPDGAVFVEPEQLGDTTHYISYRIEESSEEFRCLAGAFETDSADESSRTHSGSSGDTLRTYRLAVATTGEYTQFFGSQANAIAAITTTVNNVNAIYNVEVAVQLNLIANNNLVVYTDPTTDPYPLSNLNAEVQADLDATIGDANYDIGHLFHASGFSGNAGCIGCICTTGTKGSGWSRSATPQGGNFTFLVSHEMGHQHGANHSWNGTGCGGEVSAARYEPGSGTTIMSYSSICGSDNIQGTAVGDLYFHSGSRRQIMHYIASGGGSGCAATSATGNGIPTISAGADYTIPQGTPFVLTATGNDPDTEPLTFSWEQYDLGIKAALNAVDEGTIPLFRSFPPASASSRTFPRYSDLLAGNLFPGTLGEQLPSTNRTMSFRATARDNRAGSGAGNDDLMTVTVSGDPFEVTAPDATDALECGAADTVAWDVGGGSVAATVDILLSTDGGNTFPTTLAAGTANDGSESVTAPATPVSNVRVRINSVGNVFFNISESTSITDTLAPAVTCPADVTIECDDPSDPASTGMATAIDACDSSPTVSFSDAVADGACPQASVITRTWAATDAAGNSSSCDQTVNVVDTTPPDLSVGLTPDVLWPPNHKMWTVTASITVTDNCDPAPAISLVSITSNEDDNANGDGNTSNDIRDANFDTDDREFRLRAERQGGSDGRVYTVTYAATDGCGNTTETSAEVRVPHDQSGNALAWSGVATDGTGLDPHATQWSLLIPSSAEFDALSIDTARAYVGNFTGVQTPVDVEVVDYQQDGLFDLVLVYDAGQTRDLQSLSNRSLGLHYHAADGTDYAILDVMELVAPVQEPPLQEATGDERIRVTGSDIVADPQ